MIIASPFTVHIDGIQKLAEVAREQEIAADCAAELAKYVVWNGVDPIPDAECRTKWFEMHSGLKPDDANLLVFHFIFKAECKKLREAMN